jgi:hypothetical protein
VDLLVDLLTGRVSAHNGDPEAGRPVIAHATVGKPLIQVVVGLDTLTGTDDLPGELVGYGPVPAGLAREAAADGVWKRLVTDPVSGALLDHGRQTCRPPAALNDFVRARDQICRHPICTRRTPDADLDHHQRWEHHGGTEKANLFEHCRHHHVLEENEAWEVITNPDGSPTWATPTGCRYTSEPIDYRPFTDPARTSEQVRPMTAPVDLELDDDPPPF